MESAGKHGNSSSLPLLKPVKITSNCVYGSKCLSQLLEEGVIDATLGADLLECLGRAPHISRLIPDFKMVEQEYYRKTGIFPIMHWWSSGVRCTRSTSLWHRRCSTR
jgi:4,5-dihydroxyphthalate decarboxylase